MPLSCNILSLRNKAQIQCSDISSVVYIVVQVYICSITLFQNTFLCSYLAFFYLYLLLCLLQALLLGGNQCGTFTWIHTSSVLGEKTVCP